MGTVIGYLRPHKLRVACGITIKFTAAVLELILPLLLAHVIDVLVPAGDMAGIWRTSALMMALAFGAAGCNITANRMAAKVSMTVTESLRKDLYEQISLLSCAQADRLTESSLVSRLTNDTYNVHQLFDKIQRGGIRAPMLVLGGLFLTFLLEPVLACVQLVVCTGTFLAMGLITRRGIPHYEKAQAAVDTVVRVIRENASGVRVIKGIAGQETERARFSAVSQKARDAEIKAGTIMAAANPSADLLLNSGLVWVILTGAVCVNRGTMGSGQIVAFLSYFAVIQNATIGIAKLFLKISKGIASARRIEEILLMPGEQPITDSSETSDAELGMDNVSFSYLGVEQDLEAASFQIKQGQTLGILGPTGSGKTTLISLLLRLYDAGSGVVWVGGKDVTSHSRAYLTQRFGVVFQNEALLAASIFENISFLRGLSEEQVLAAAKTAQLMDFIRQLPEGLHTRVDIRGANLSGGQRQRLLIARALAASPPILILDNADSALDYRTAANLWTQIAQDHPGITLVIISERIASLRSADHILVLENGRITAQGRHETLMESSPRYGRMAKMQMGGDRP